MATNAIMTLPSILTFLLKTFLKAYITEAAYDEKGNTPLTASDFLNGLSYAKAIEKLFALEAEDKGKGTINYRLRDAF